MPRLVGRKPAGKIRWSGDPRIEQYSFFEGAFEVGKRGVEVIRHREHALGATRYALTSFGRERRQSRNRLACACDDHFFAFEHALQQLREMSLGVVNVYGFFVS